MIKNLIASLLLTLLVYILIGFILDVVRHFRVNFECYDFSKSWFWNLEDHFARIYLWPWYRRGL